MWWRYKPYVSVAKRRVKAARQIKTIEKKGRKTSPVRIEGRTIARSFWGKAWCDHLEACSDYSNRLPRGRTYVRNGSVCDLQIEPGKIKALVCGSELYQITISIAPATRDCWAALKRDCAGQIGAVVELLQGRLSESVMKIITRRDSGLFPRPSDIKLDCSCPDWADMCKHVAAALYGVGARLDQQPELLFVLRQVDHLELITDAVKLEAPTDCRSGRKTIAAGDLSDVFGIEISGSSAVDTAADSADAKAIGNGPAVKSARKPKRSANADHGKKVDRATKARRAKKAEPAKPARVPRRRRQPAGKIE
jgi:uncharacterized Zn finger protein